MSKRNSKKLLERAYGKEPEFNAFDLSSDEYDWDLAKAYSWYRTNSTTKQEKTWTLDYMKEKGFSKDDMSYVKSLPAKTFLNQGRFFRLISRGATHQAQRTKELNAFLSSSIKEGKKKKETAIPKKSVQDYIREQVEEYLGDLELKIDDITAKLSNKQKVEFCILSWLKSNDVKSVQAKRIAEYWEPHANEILQAINKEDPQLIEGYSFMGRVALKRLHKTLIEWIEVCNQYAIDVKPIRKKRRKKNVSK